MSNIIQAAFNKSLDTYGSFRLSAIKAISSAGGGGGGSPYSVAANNGPLESLGGTNSAARQYSALRDIPYTAIRPIAIKCADQPIKVGYAPSKAVVSAEDRKMRTKSLLPTRVYQDAPRFVQKAMVDGVEVDNSHWLLDSLDEPNPYMDGWSLRYCSVMSLIATGDAFWMIDESGGRLQFYYLPKTWVTPKHLEGDPFSFYEVKPPNIATEPLPVPREDMIHFRFVDPADPLGSMSPLQTQARAVNTDDEIQKAQFAAMKNGLYPGMILHAGRLPPKPNETGLGPRPVLTPEQRRTLIDTIRLHASGAMHYGDPLIIDGMIEAAEPYMRTPAELGFLDSSQLTRDRIMHGLGVNPIVTGQVENANRASAVAANETFYQNVVNPILTLQSNALTQRLSTRDSAAGRKLHVWIEKAVARDEDLQLSKMQAASTAGAITKNEWRESLGLEKVTDPEADKLPPPPAPAGAPPGAGGLKPAGKKRKRRDRGRDFFVKGLLSELF